MTTPLPASPNLEQLKNQARDLHKAQRAHDPAAAARLQQHLPGLADMPIQAISELEFTLSEAQLIIAREYGFPSWPRLKKHIDALAPDPLEQFKTAVQTGDAAVVRNLLRRHTHLRQQIDAPLFGFDAPAICLAKNNPALTDVLLHYGADINARSQWWAGGFGVLDGADPEAAEYLISRGARVDVHAAAGLGKLDTLRELLLAEPALVNARGGDGQMPLHVARTPEIAALLLDSGAELEARDIDHGSTPAQYAVGPRPDVCRFLLTKGAQDDIFMQCALGNVAKVRAMLLDDPALLNSLTTQGRHNPTPAPGEHIYLYTLTLDGGATPLMVAAGHNQQSVAALLLEMGADINAQEVNSSALHFAAWYGHLDMIRFLLAHGADGNRTDKNYRSTPAGWAEHNGQNMALELLLSEAKVTD